MTQPAKAQEPSMEEILASIRRIISDDEAKPNPNGKGPDPVAPTKPVLEGLPPSKSAPPRPAPSMPAPKNSQNDIDAMMAGTAQANIKSKPEPVVEDDVFELTEQMAISNMAQPSFQRVESHDDIEFSESNAIASHDSGLASPFDAPPQKPAIMSSSTVSAVESAFNALATTVLSNNARTLEDLVKEMLRPMLKSWLDDNLPNLVERIVKAEIERVARGR
jgi:cell pole-organizing protein PopZ